MGLAVNMQANCTTPGEEMQAAIREGIWARQFEAKSQRKPQTVCHNRQSLARSPNSDKADTAKKINRVFEKLKTKPSAIRKTNSHVEESLTLLNNKKQQKITHYIQTFGVSELHCKLL